MKTTAVKRTLLLAGVIFGLNSFAQINLQPEMQNYRDPGLGGLNVFESPKDDTPFDGVKVRVGGDFALQFQMVDHTNADAADTLVDLGGNFNLPTANLNLDVALYNGVRMHLRTYLSSRHHVEAWVKGGYIQIDRLDFIQEGWADGFMDIATIKVGMDDINYGDAQYRRSDNARALYNPFVGNYIMDAFTTEAFGEIWLRPNDFIVVLGLSNGKLNQSPLKGAMYDYTPSFYAKLGWDSQLNDDTRVRITGSFYTSGNYNRAYLYGGDRTGARYYNVMHTQNGSYDSDFSGRYNPGFTKFSSFQINPFIKFKGLEFFGIYEVSSGDKSEMVTGGSVTQIGAELLYRFGGKEQFFVGGRYNSVSGKESENASDLAISRINGGLGWFMTHNVLLKVEYVTQSYTGDHWIGMAGFQEGTFNGAVFEAVVSF